MFERLQVQAGKVKGYTRRGKKGPVRVREYSRAEHIRMLMKKDGLTRKEAIQYLNRRAEAENLIQKHGPVPAFEKFTGRQLRPATWEEKMAQFQKEATPGKQATPGKKLPPGKRARKLVVGKGKLDPKEAWAAEKAIYDHWKKALKRR